jgi:hypothetical protein
MTGQRRVEESENAKFKDHFQEVSQLIKLAAPWREAVLALRLIQRSIRPYR